MYLKEPAGKACIDKPAAPLPRIGKAALIPALVCAGISVMLMRAVFFKFFFLVPLGICAVIFGPVAAWVSAVCVLLGNGVWSVGLSNAGLDTLYFAVLCLGFTWIMAGSILPAIPPVRTVFRFIIASAAGALVFLLMIFSLGNDEGFSAFFRSQSEAIASSFIAAFGTDAAQRALLEQTFTADRVIDLFLMVFSRGGALFSVLFQMFLNRQAAFVLVRLFRRQGGSASGDLIGFYVPRRTIVVLSVCLPVVLFCQTISLGIIEIAAWNLLIICAIMFFAQGCGIVMFYLARRPMPTIMRFLCGILLVCVIFSPGINVLAVGMLVLLGIAENWLPLRAKKQEMPGV